MILAGVFVAFGLSMPGVVPALLGGEPPGQGQGHAKGTSSGEPPVFLNCRIMAGEREDVPSQQSGRLIVIGTELQPGEAMPPPSRLVTIEFPVLSIAVKPDEKVAGKRPTTFKIDSKEYRAWCEGDPLEPGLLAIARVSRRFRRLEVGDKVRAGQILGVVDPALAHDELVVRKAALDATEVERSTAEIIRSHQEKHRRAIRVASSKGAATSDEVAQAETAYDRWNQEVIVKTEALRTTKARLLQENTLLKMHEIRSSISGVIKDIYKNAGDAVYRLDTVFQVQNTSSLRLEGWVDAQHLPSLRRGLEAVVEPTQLARPLMVLRGHLQEISDVAVSRGTKPFIVSASEDRTVSVWDPVTGLRTRTLPHDVAVRAVACTPQGSGKNLCLTGAADGSARLWDLDDLNQPFRELSARHKAAITSVAFSPDGEWCATGGEDHDIYLWKTATAEQLSRKGGAHQGAVTSLRFASSSRLVSAGRDNRLVVWELSRDGEPKRIYDLDGRGTGVTTLSPDGERVLFDHGPELSLLSLADRGVVGVLRNTTKDLNFATLALFSPTDGKVLLTGGAPEGGLQLWRAPTASRPAAELRRLTWPDSPSTCAAFAPDGSFVVSGTKDRNVMVWAMPSRDELERRLTGRLTLVEPFVSGSGGQARVWAELKNPGAMVIGGPATLVITPGPQQPNPPFPVIP
jgi:WD40 repeat protein